MKVKGRTDLDLTALKETLQQEAVKTHIRSKGLGQGQPPADELPKTSSAGTGEDKVNVEIAKLINDQLNPDVLLAERRSRVEDLKRLVQSGQYKPKSEDVARSMIEEVATEIFMSGPIPPVVDEE